VCSLVNIHTAGMNIPFHEQVIRWDEILCLINELQVISRDFCQPYSLTITPVRELYLNHDNSSLHRDEICSASSKVQLLLSERRESCIDEIAVCDLPVHRPEGGFRGDA
jgi:hypothetical protein